MYILSFICILHPKRYIYIVKFFFQIYFKLYQFEVFFKHPLKIGFKGEDFF